MCLPCLGPLVFLIPKTFKLFVFPITYLLAYLMNVIPITYLSAYLMMVIPITYLSAYLMKVIPITYLSAYLMKVIPITYLSAYLMKVIPEMHHRTKFPLILKDYIGWKVWWYERGNQKPLIEDGNTIQWPKERGQKDKTSYRKLKFFPETINAWLFFQSLLCPYWKSNMATTIGHSTCCSYKWWSIVIRLVRFVHDNNQDNAYSKQTKREN